MARLSPWRSEAFPARKADLKGFCRDHCQLATGSCRDIDGSASLAFSRGGSVRSCARLQCRVPGLVTQRSCPGKGMATSRS